MATRKKTAENPKKYLKKSVYFNDAKRIAKMRKRAMALGIGHLSNIGLVRIAVDHWCGVDIRAVSERDLEDGTKK